MSFNPAKTSDLASIAFEGNRDATRERRSRWVRWPNGAYPRYLLPVSIRVLGGIIIGQLCQASFRCEYFCEVGQPGDVLANCGVRYLKSFFYRMERNPYANGIIVPGQHFDPEEPSHQSGHPLLPVNQDPLAR